MYNTTYFIYSLIVFSIIITIIKSTDPCNFKKSGKNFTIEFKGLIKNYFKFSLTGIYNYIYYYGDTYCLGEWKMQSIMGSDNYSMIYYGEIKNGMPHGINENNNMIKYNYNLDNDIEIKYIYTGSWNNGNKEGSGRQQMTFIDKKTKSSIIITIQKGLFNKNDIIEGTEFSYLIDVNSCFDYVGNFYNNRPHGNGIIHYNNGTIFEGEFIKGNLINIVKTISDETYKFSCLEKLIQPE